MTAHLTQDELAGYKRRELAPDRLLSADRHLGGCADCRQQLRALNPEPKPLTLLAEFEGAAHLSYEQMCAYLDSQMEAGRQEVESHTQVCQNCARELNALLKFDHKLASELSASAPARAEAAKKPSWRESFAGFFAAPQRLRFVGVSAALIIAGVLATSSVQGGAGTEGGAGSLFKLGPEAGAGHFVFLGGFLLIGVGVAGLLYGLFKRFK